MTQGRTVLRHSRVYVDGYDLSGYARDWASLGCTFDEGVDDALSLEVKATILGQASVSVGPVNSLFDNTATTGVHVAMEPKVQTLCDVMIPIGIQAAPANNDPVFAAQLEMTGYQASNANPVGLTMPFKQSARADNMLYARPWGALLHSLAAATAANTSTGLDQTAQTTKGGWMMYQITAAAGSGAKTATIKVQDAGTNSDGSFSDLLSSGVINCAAGVSGVVALAPTATVNRYVRWQITLGTATSVTFALAWIRGNR